MAEPSAPHSDQAGAEPRIIDAARSLGAIKAQVDGARAELARVTRDLGEEQRDFNAMHATQLLEANEQLVLSALQAEAVAETAVGNLDELARSSQRDPLTDTPNRALMLDRIEGAIASARRRGTLIALLFLDLDDFKRINDTLGHGVGDAVLQLAARRLESVVRDSDTVSRHSGDEFLVLLAEIAQAADAAGIAEKMLAALAAPCRIADHAIELSASLGIAVYPGDGADAASLIGRADAAMYRSKHRGPGNVTFHADSAAARDGATAEVARLGRSTRESATHLTHLREANEQLVIAAVASQEHEAFTDEAHRRQIHFLAMVAHELRNPLGPIKTAAAMLNRAGSDAGLLASLQGIIQRQLAVMSKLVEDLLDGARVDAGKFRIDSASVDMSQVLGLSIETCRPLLDAKSQHLKLQLPAGSLVLQGDAMRLAQVVTNLLENASKYTAEGGEIGLSVALPEHEMTITVADNGIGITAAALPHIFDLFVQDTKVLNRDNRGLGIGLAVVRDLVQAHGGRVVGRSAGRGLGSEFVVTLPRSSPATSSPPERRPESPSAWCRRNSCGAAT